MFEIQLVQKLCGINEKVKVKILQALVSDTNKYFTETVFTKNIFF